MTQSNAQIIRSLYDAFARGDAGSVLGTFHPQIIWNEAENIPYADRNPYIGPEQIGEGVFGRIMTEWEGFSVTPEKIIDGGDTIVALGRYRGVWKATGHGLDSQFAHAWTLQDGRITSFQQYADTLQFEQVTRAVMPPPIG